MSEAGQEKARARARHDRIVDVVFARRSVRGRALWVPTLGAALALHAGAWLWARSSEPSLESWSAELALKVHAELGRQQVVAFEEPPPPEQASAPQPAPPPVVARATARERARKLKAAPAAQAAQVLAKAPSASEPLDLTGDSFVSGAASAYAGGVSAARGTNAVAVNAGALDPNAPATEAPGEPDQSSPVKLAEDEWNCAWPRAADAEQIDEQAVVVRVLVQRDGRAAAVSLVSDPGHGFGQAAVACALRTRFAPARDRQGNPIRAQSPPIRVRFTR